MLSVLSVFDLPYSDKLHVFFAAAMEWQPAATADGHLQFEETPQQRRLLRGLVDVNTLGLLPFSNLIDNGRCGTIIFHVNRQWLLSTSAHVHIKLDRPPQNIPDTEQPRTHYISLSVNDVGAYSMVCLLPDVKYAKVRRFAQSNHTIDLDSALSHIKIELQIALLGESLDVLVNDRVIRNAAFLSNLSRQSLSVSIISEGTAISSPVCDAIQFASR